VTPIVSVLSEKGGVAKTATVEGLAAAALAPPLRLLAIDLDPRHSLSVGLGFADCYDERGRLRDDGGLFSVNDLLADDGADGRAATAVATSPWADTLGVLLAERPLGLRESDALTGWSTG
jgi:cellulose biosynthesis protein BcsQ